VVDYIEMFYNSKRRHGFNDLLSPVEYEEKFTGLPQYVRHFRAMIQEQEK